MKVKFSNIQSFVRRSMRFGLFAPSVNIFLTYFGRFIPYSIAKKLSDRRHKVVEKKLLKILGPLPDLDSLTTYTQTDSNEKIWFLWLQGEEKMPAIPRLCLDSIRRYSAGHEVVVLTESNLHDFLSIPDRIKTLRSSGNIPPALFSDYIRIELLNRYGGLWLDATMLLTADLNEEIFHLPFYSHRSVPEKAFFVSDYRWAVFMMSARPETKLLKFMSWALNKFWNSMDAPVDYFMTDYLIDIAYRHYPEIKSEIDSIPLNNPDIHRMTTLLIEEHKADSINELLGRTSMFKLNWKAYTDAQLSANPRNVYNFLKQR